MQKLKYQAPSCFNLPQVMLSANTFGGFGKRPQSLSDIQQIFNTGPHGTPLKIKISKIGLRHVLSWPKLGLGPKLHDNRQTHRQDSCYIRL